MDRHTPKGSVRTGHGVPCGALPLNSVYIRKFDFFKEIVNFKNVKHDISQTRNIEIIGNLTVDRCRLLLR